MLFFVEVGNLENQKNRSILRTWGCMLSFIPFGWNGVFKWHYLLVEFLVRENLHLSQQVLS